MKTATDRAAEAIEAAELMFTAEMGATLNLNSAAKGAERIARRGVLINRALS